MCQRLHRYLLTALLAVSGLLPVSAVTAAQPLPMVMPEPVFASLPRIGSTIGGSQLLDRGGLFQGRFTSPDGEKEDFTPGQTVRIFRQGLRLVIPHSKETLGILAVAVGEARVLSAAELATSILDGDTGDRVWLRITATYQEIMPGDSFMPTTNLAHWQPAACPPPRITQPAPEPAASGNPPVERPPAEIIALSSHFGLMASNNDRVIMSGGCDQGYAPGNEVSIWRAPEKLHERQAGAPIDNPFNNATSVLADNPPIDRISTPVVRIGTARVLSAYPDTAILQIIAAQRPVQTGDPVRLLHPHAPHHASSKDAP